MPSSRIVPDSFGALGLLAVPIGVLREQEIKRVSDKKQLNTSCDKCQTELRFMENIVCSEKQN